MHDPMPFPPAQPPAQYAPPPPQASSRLGLLVLILLLLVGAMILPYGVEEFSYAMKRGELRAKSDAAAAELAQLSTNAKLVKLADTSLAFRDAAKIVEESVVHINTESVAVVPKDTDDEWGPRSPRGKGPQRTRGQGSGVIVDSTKGYILTNFHVIQDATALDVRLSDGTRTSEVTLVGYDVLTDLAVLKIRPTKLKAIQWGNSNDLEVGDWVLAIGNPYGLDRTVTVGILSAKERRGVGSTPYQEFLQTDAAVNPGNSGGPLVDVTGRLIGINTAIIGESFQGISFAIPSNSARVVYDKIIKEGRVARGWFGVGLDDLADADEGEPAGKAVVGVRVTRVVPGSPAAQAGIRPGDILEEWDGKPVTDAMEFTLEIARTEIGKQVACVINRGGTRRTLQITIGQRPEATELKR